MKCELVKLFFKAPLHLGEKEGMMEDSNFIIHSDILFSALCNSFRSLYGKTALEEFLVAFTNNNPSFLITSAFPYYKDILFFPIPMDIKPPYEDIKNFKKLRFVPKDLWEELCRRGTLKKEGYTFIQDKRVLIAEELLKDLRNKREKSYPMWKERETQRVALDTVTSASNIFSFREVVFRKDAGLFFLINWKDKSLEKKIKAAINLLGDEGIGGDRNSGKGVFIPSFGEVELKEASARDYLLLSLYYPKKEEVENFEGVYDFKIRGGFVYSLDNTTRRKKYVRMLTEGSVIKGRKPIGSLVDVTPKGFSDHKVYRYGYAFFVPVGE